MGRVKHKYKVPYDYSNENLNTPMHKSCCFLKYRLSDYVLVPLCKAQSGLRFGNAIFIIYI